MAEGHSRINSFVTDFNLMLEDFLFLLILKNMTILWPICVKLPVYIKRQEPEDRK